jgi:hypothetical protein
MNNALLLNSLQTARHDTALITPQARLNFGPIRVVEAGHQP